MDARSLLNRIDPKVIEEQISKINVFSLGQILNMKTIGASAYQSDSIAVTFFIVAIYSYRFCLFCTSFCTSLVLSGIGFLNSFCFGEVLTFQSREAKLFCIYWHASMIASWLIKNK